MLLTKGWVMQSKRCASWLFSEGCPSVGAKALAQFIYLDLNRITIDILKSKSTKLLFFTCICSCFSLLYNTSNRVECYDSNVERQNCSQSWGTGLSNQTACSKSLLCLFSSVWLWAKYSTSLCLRLLAHRIRVVIRVLLHKYNIRRS